MSKSKQRNWSAYNQRLKQHSRIEMFLSPEVKDHWYHHGVRRPGGKLRYSDLVIETCLLIREYFGLGLRQTEGFVESLFEILGENLQTPDYTTLSRRAANLKVVLPPLPKSDGGLVIAIDATGLSVHSRHEWNHLKHGGTYEWKKKWRKLHIAIDTKTGLIASATYSESTVADGQRLETLIEDIDAPIQAVCADMAYDTVRCRKALDKRDIRQLIPPLRAARLAKENRNQRQHKAILKERDEAIHYIRHNSINESHTLARASWKKKVGYHARSRVETTFSQIKTHTSGKLTNRKETTRATQALIKCKLINQLISQ